MAKHITAQNSGQRTVVVAIDESEHAEYAFDFYIENVRRAQDTVVLVTVPEYHSIFNGSILFTDPATVAVLVKEEEKRIQQILQKYTRKMRDANIGGKLREDVGKAGETILSVAQEENASLIVVGSRGIGKIRRTILGSVSDYCLHHSTVPVLICRMEV
ncbi:universal stress protein YxiE-like [Pecten maximus]|uniref:universal stress protein YxiE-like n=1 Tax=Pecten maximus TaxID=6579 RepID=UPI00145864CB|nr:universal stress protein YxiE-like [Pecten maximus]